MHIADANKTEPTKRKSVIVLLFGTLVFGGTVVLDSWNEYNSFTELTELVSLTENLNDVHHHLQIERGLTGVYLGGGGQKSIVALTRQHVRTDSVLGEKQNFLANVNGNAYGPQVAKKFEEAMILLATLSEKRNAILSKEVSFAQGSSFYSELNTTVLDLFHLIATIPQNAEISSQFLSFENFLRGKERAEAERAQGALLCSQDSITTSDIVAYSVTVSGQSLFFDAFLTTATDEQLDVFLSIMDEQTLSATQDYRNAIEVLADVDPGARAGLDLPSSQQWYEVFTSRIAQLKESSDVLTGELIASTQEQQSAALFGFGAYLLLLIGLAVIGVVLR